MDSNDSKKIIKSKIFLGEHFSKPSLKEILYRAPWYIGLIAAGYLLIGLYLSPDKYRWLDGRFWEAYFTASVLFYTNLVCIIFMIGRIISNKYKFDYSGFSMSCFLLAVLYLFSECFMHIIKGFIIWPFLR